MRNMIVTAILIFVHTFAYLLPKHLTAAIRQDERFSIYWNMPSQSCQGKTAIDFDKFHIRVNKQQQFYGDQVVIFYEKALGLYPWIEPVRDTKSRYWKPGEIFNGGLPQNVDMAAHMEKVVDDIERAIPDPYYPGLAVIDYEAWRPIYNMNWFSRTVYRQQSTADALRRYPNISQKAAVSIGKMLFERHAKDFLVQTVRLARELRPYAKWGFFDYPICNYDAGQTEHDLECLNKYKRFNERMLWLYAESTALYPPIYLYANDKNNEATQRYVHARVLEAEWIQHKLKRNIPIYLYSKIEYATNFLEINETSENFYSTDDICNTLNYPAEMGIRGVVIWSSSARMKQRCRGIADYVNTVFGPDAESLHYQLNRCSLKRCSGHGKCVREDRLPPVTCARGLSAEHYICECDRGYFGEYCDSKLPWDARSALITGQGGYK